MVVYRNMAAVTKCVAKKIKQVQQPVKQRDIWRLNAKLSNNLQQMNFTEDSLAVVTDAYGNY